MTTKTTLKAARRDDTGKGDSRKLRMTGRVPAVLYGKDMDVMHLSVNAHDALRLFQTISVENTLVDLDVEGVGDTFSTLVREIQTHPYKPDLVHIDFLRVQEGVAIEVEIPVHLVGTPIGVKQHGGVLEQIIHDLTVRCVPSSIPEAIEVDVSELDVDESLRVADLVVGEGVEVTVPAERTVCLVAVPRIVAEPTEEAAEAAEGAEGAGAEPGEGAEAREAGEDKD